MSKFVITEADIGRRVRTRCGVEGEIWRVRGDSSYPVKAVLYDVGVYSFKQEGWYWRQESWHEYDLVEFVEDTQENNVDTLNITKDDVGKLFKDRWGAVIKVVYVHPNSTALPVTAVNTANGVASNYQLNGQFLLEETTEFDLVERYKPMSW